MSDYFSRRAIGVKAKEADGTQAPVACPACTSPAITTTSKNPSAESYWRCRRCGEIWNAGRRHTPIARTYR